MIFWLVFGIVLPPATTALWLPYNAWVVWKSKGVKYGRRHFVSDWFATGLIQAGVWEIGGLPKAFVLGALISAAIAGLWWWIRRQRFKALELLGAKSLALRQALVDAVKRSRVPSGVLRPGETS